MALLTFLVIVSLVSFVFGENFNQTLSQDYYKAANFAIDLHNRLSNYPHAYKAVHVLSGNFHIYPPARVKYAVTAEVAETVCKNDGTVRLSDCELQNDAKVMTCNFVVLATPGFNMGSTHLLSDECA